MRHKGVDKEETRRKIVDAVGRGFRSHGYAGIGVDALARAAGVTSGAFYAHLGSKDGAFDVALAAGLDEAIAALPEFQREHGAGWVQAFADYYLGKAHRADLECGCAIATLAPEVVRAGTRVQAAFEKKMSRIVDLVAEGLAGGSPDERLARAWSMLAVLIGGINLARAMKSVRGADEVAAATRAAAVKVAGRARGRSG
jgi:TetR/AcrR family transcriptional repressor of nem operon